MYAILKGKEIVLEPNVRKWAEWFEDDARRVARTELPDGTLISTVFLGLDHGFGGEPAWFETMVFTKESQWSEVDMARYATYDEAEKGHEAMVAKYS